MRVNFKKGKKFFNKKLRKFLNQNNTTLEKSLLTLGKRLMQQKQVGKGEKMENILQSK